MIGKDRESLKAEWKEKAPAAQVKVSRGYKNCLLIMRRLKESGIGPVLFRDTLRSEVGKATQIVHPPAVGCIINALVDMGFLEKLDESTYKILKYEEE